MKNYSLWQAAAEPPDADDAIIRRLPPGQHLLVRAMQRLTDDADHSEPTDDERADYERTCNEAADERMREQEAAYEAWQGEQEWQWRAVVAFPEDGESLPF